MNSEKEIKWYIVYDELAKKLFEYYQKNIKLSSVYLFNSLKDHKEFIDSNRWFEKFINDDNISSGLDPIHLFSSINGNSLREEFRINRIQILLKVFGSNLKCEAIDFTGCPAPPVIKQSSIRSLGMQDQIWNFFADIYHKGNSDLRAEDFELYKGWYGVEIASLTTFMFWVRSDSFIPLDKNTRQYLQISHFLLQNFSIEDYIFLVRKVDEYNYDDKIWGEKAIFREIARVSYTLVNSKKSIKISNSLKNLFGIEDTKDEISKETSSSPINLKIIALKILDGCNQNHLNVLKNNKENIFYFEKAFKIEKESIKYDSTKDIQLYNIKYPNNININVTAIVGKNGSGKSSLIELLAKTINNITYPFRDSLNTEELVLEDNLATELYYRWGDKVICLQVINEETKVFEYVLEKDDSDISFFNKQNNFRPFSKEDFYSFFYTICINYSHYSLNDLHLGPWIQKLFHKNDSYQAPIVFNPMRTHGNIDINTENELVKSRLVANLFEQVEEGDLGIRQLTDSQKVIEVQFELDIDKSKKFYKEIEELVGANTEGVYIEIRKYLDFVFEIFNVNVKRTGRLVQETEKYIFRKLIRIWESYPHYGKLFKFENPRKLDIDIKEWEIYVEKVKQDSSHIVYKLKQAINFLKYNSLLPQEDSFTLDLDYLNLKIQKQVTQFPELADIEIIELLPPPIFKSKIIIVDGTEELSDFNKLSSGEKQQIHSINSIIYHLKNLNSIKSIGTDLVKYRNINLILDEIELYYHPELQRKYISHLLKMLNKFYFEDIDSINICLITHSPYILSDIPDFYTLRLEDGKPRDDKAQTFGANIHGLLADSFFLGKSYMGEFAHKYITDLIDQINNVEKIKSEEEFDYYRKKIEIIDEPFFKYKLIETLESKYPEFNKNNLIELISKKEKELENLKRRRNND